MAWFLQSIKQSVRILWGSFYLLSLLISIPIAFKIGGLYCGLSFTFCLFHLYLLSTSLHVIAKKTGNSSYILATTLLYYLQHIAIASLLYIFLSVFSDGLLTTIFSSNSSDFIPSLIKKTDEEGHLPSKNYYYLFFYYYYRYAVRLWRHLLSHSTPFFTLLEGFFTILGIQAVGETYTWLTVRGNYIFWVAVTWVASSGIVATALYFLLRIYITQEWNLSQSSATTMGITMSLVAALGIYGIFSKNGSTIESALFLAYIIRCFYEISPELTIKATNEIMDSLKEIWFNHQASISFSDHVLSYYNNVILKNIHNSFPTSSVAKNITDLPAKVNTDIITFTKSNTVFNSIYQTWLFYVSPFWNILKNFTINIPTTLQNLCLVTWKLTYESVSISIVINLCFRVFIFYSATRIIPAVQRKNNAETTRSRNIMKALYWFSPCIVIAMYTNLLLQYSGELESNLCVWGCDIFSNIANKFINGDNTSGVDKVEMNSWGFWNWCNIFWTIFIYGCELVGL